MSHSPLEAESRARSDIFVGRSRELSWTERWVKTPRAETRVVLLTGIGGIGKSALLRRMADLARGAGVGVALTDLEMVGLAPAVAIDYLNRQLALPLARWRDGKARLFIGLDHYDDVGSLDDWLREELLPQCPEEGGLVVIASRQELRDAWHNDPRWSLRLKRFPVPLLNGAEARDLLRHIDTEGLCEREADRLVREAQGLPLALVVKAQSPAADLASAGAPLRIASRLCREVTDSQLEAVLEVLTVLHHADQELISACLTEPVTASLYRRVSSLSMVTTSEGGLRLHSVVREHLFRDLTLRAPHRKNRLITRALTALGTRVNDPISSPDLRRLDGLNLLFLCRDAIGQIFSADNGQEPEYSTGALRRDELPVLHELLEDVAVKLNHFRSTGQLHQILDVTAEHLPSSITVFRATDGQAAAFSAMVPLHRESLPLLSRFAVIAGYLESVSEPQRDALNAPPARTDTFFFTGGVDASAPAQSLRVWPQVLRHAISLLAAGGRLVGITTDSEALRQSQLLGFHVLDVTCSSCDTSKPLYYIELDLRQGRFAPWALAFMRAYLTQVSGTSAEDAKEETIGELAAQLRQALRGLQHPGRVDRGTADLLRRVLTQPSPPAPLTPEQQNLLRFAFLEAGKQKKAFAIARELNISRPTYFRRLNEALLALATVWFARPT